MRKDGRQRAKNTGISSRRVWLRLLPSQETLLPVEPLFLSFVSTCLQCHLLCRRSVFRFLLVDYVKVCCRSRLCTHLFPLSELGVRLHLTTGWSPVVISLYHHLLVASVGVCCQSRLCTHLSLLSELGVHLCLSYIVICLFLSTHFLISTFALDGLVFDCDIQGQVH